MLQKLFRYAAHHLHLDRYFASPGDLRLRGQIPAPVMVRGLLVGRLLRDASNLAVETMVRTHGDCLPGVDRSFGDDALGYFTARLDPAVTRAALTECLQRAKRMKAFDDVRWIGWAIDGTTAGRSREQHCPLCRPVRDASHAIQCYLHHMVAISVVGTSYTLPFDAEPYGPGDSEYAAGQRLLHRAVTALGKRFAQYVVVDGAFATAPFLHAASEDGMFVIARLKENLPALHTAARQRFSAQAPTLIVQEGNERIEIWDADFPPWEALDWQRVRVIRYRQHRANGSVIEAYWLTNIPRKNAGSLALYRMAKSRWEIENQCYNDGKNRYGLDHICHHEANSILIDWLVTFLAMVIERLFRLRHLRRGTHPPLSAIDLCRRMWLDLAADRSRRGRVCDTS